MIPVCNEQRVLARSVTAVLAWTDELAIPKLRDGSYFPSLLEPRCRVGRASAREAWTWETS